MDTQKQMEKAQAELIWVDGKFVFELEIEKVLINYGTINEDGTPPKETFEAYFSRKTLGLGTSVSHKRHLMFQ